MGPIHQRARTSPHKDKAPIKWFILSSKTHQIDKSGTFLDADWFLYLNQHLGILDKKVGKLWFVQDQDCWRWLGQGERRHLSQVRCSLTTSDSVGASWLCSGVSVHWQYWELLCFGLRTLGPFILCQCVSAPHEGHVQLASIINPFGDWLVKLIKLSQLVKLSHGGPLGKPQGQEHYQAFLSACVGSTGQILQSPMVLPSLSTHPSKPCVAWVGLGGGWNPTAITKLLNCWAGFNWTVRGRFSGR